MIFRKKVALITSALVLSFAIGTTARAMPLGTLLYRTSSNGNLYAYNSSELVTVKNKILTNIYTGHVAMYVGQENGIDYIVEAMPNGIIKVPAKYFLNSKNGEKLIGAKIPKNISPAQQLKVVELAKSLASSNLAYDFDFKKQKGPGSGEWICVGLTEKLYESANISNPLDIKQLQYNPEKYAVDITPDGFDNYSEVNKNKDCFSKDFEFSKISANTSTLIPLPEILGFSAGLEKDGQRYFFFPLTQYYQNTLKDVEVDIQLESEFVDNDVRGKAPELAMIFKWSLINNPKSALLNIGRNVLAWFKGESLDDVKKIVLNEAQALVDDIKEDNSISDEERDFLIEEISQVKNNITDKINVASSKILPAIKVDNSEVKTLSVDSFSALATSVSSTSDLSIDSAKIEEEETAESIELIINKVYSTGNDDYVEIYNPGNNSIDLSKVDLRLYKTKTSATPSLMIRIGNEGDAFYPGGLTIPAKGKYLITRTSASESIKQKAQAISSRSEFTFAGNGYTIYLSLGVVSSDTDEDIIDKVGFGSAKYYEKSPALEILDNYFLGRKNEEDKNDNSLDFALSAVSSTSTATTSTATTTTSTTNNSSSSTNNTSSNSNTTSNNNNSTNTSTSTTATSTATSTNPVSTSTATSTATSTQPLATSTPNLLPLLISKVYSTESDDYVEIYNPNDTAIDLKEKGIRLYKTKTSATPSLMIRIGNSDDGAYPGGFIIEAKGSYLITRADASSEIKAMAQAISSRSEFTFVGDAQTIYLGSNTISSDADSDIVDKVGFGLATYYFFSPADMILDNYILTRKAHSTSTAISMTPSGPDYSLGHSYNTYNNSDDFVLVDKNYSEEDNDDFASTQVFCQGVLASSYQHNIGPFSMPGSCYFDQPYFYISDMAHLWRFDECEEADTYDAVSGQVAKHNSTWEPGVFSCALNQYYNYDSFSTPLGPEFNEDNFTVMFYYKNLYDNSRPEIMLKNSQTEESVRMKLYMDSTDFFNMPNAPFREYGLTWPFDGLWHLFAWTLNKAENRIIFYRDGLEVYSLDMGVHRLPDIDTFSIKGDNNYNLIDELAIFSRELSANEIFEYYNSGMALSNHDCALLGENFGLPYLNWDLETEEYSCSRFLGENFSAFPAVFGVKPKSLSFLWKNTNPSSEFNFSLSLLNNLGDNVFGLEFDNNNIYHFFDTWKYETGDKYNEYFSPNDDWHSVVLTHDPYFFRFNLYVDGNLIGSWRHFWVRHPDISSLKIFSNTKNARVKNISVWNTCLTSDAVLMLAN